MNEKRSDDRSGFGRRGLLSGTATLAGLAGAAAGSGSVGLLGTRAGPTAADSSGTGD